MNSDGLLILTFSLILGKPCQKITEFDQSYDSSWIDYHNALEPQKNRIITFE